MTFSRFGSHSLITSWRTWILTAFLFLILAIFLVVPHVYADLPPPPPRPQFNWLYYGIVVLVGEAIAWLIGAEFLWRMIRKTTKDKQELSRPRVYRVMLLAMVLSFLIGLVFWKALGWI